MERRLQELEDRPDRAVVVADGDARVHIRQAQQRAVGRRTAWERRGCTDAGGGVETPQVRQSVPNVSKKSASDSASW
jgi:hypothetical protein